MGRDLAKPGKGDWTWVTLNMLLSEEVKAGQTGVICETMKKLSGAFSLGPP